jgi:hypothetical protein
MIQDEITVANQGIAHDNEIGLKRFIQFPW